MPERITWSESRRLSWEDFEQVESGRSRYAAESQCGLFYSAKQVGDRMVIETEAYFVPAGSWVVRSKQTPDLLAHEQLHFDITELWNRRMRKAMKKFELPVEVFLKNRGEVRIQREYQTHFRKMMAMQRKYDNETQHGTVKKHQRKWENRIRRQLGLPS